MKIYCKKYFLYNNNNFLFFFYKKSLIIYISTNYDIDEMMKGQLKFKWILNRMERDISGLQYDFGKEAKLQNLTINTVIDF